MNKNYLPCRECGHTWLHVDTYKAEKGLCWDCSYDEQLHGPTIVLNGVTL